MSKTYADLAKRFPRAFSGAEPSPFTQRGIEWGPGWYSLVERVAAALEIHGGFFNQVKEKWGALRIYVEYPRDDQTGDILVDDVTRQRLDVVIAEAERASIRICEECGQRGSGVWIGGWRRTLCERDAEAARVPEA